MYITKLNYFIHNAAIIQSIPDLLAEHRQLVHFII